ncbi:MAG: hypothetical protein LBC26_00700 [Oscillospiraceae bacterium]|jgi:hypothetical protein|nr:hypothetical protein [Oscillospiraceae bacterium]
MYTPQVLPPALGRPAQERPRVEPVPRAHTASGGGGRHTPVHQGVRLPVSQDHANATDAARLRAEYALRLTQEARQLQKGGRHCPGPSIEETARAYVSLLRDICASFRPEADSAPLHTHLDALRGAWDDVLTMLAQKAALRLGVTAEQSGGHAGFGRALIEIHHLFAVRFCELYPTSGVEKALTLTKESVVHSAVFARSDTRSLTDALALYYYRKFFEQKETIC